MVDDGQPIASMKEDCDGSKVGPDWKVELFQVAVASWPVEDHDCGWCNDRQRPRLLCTAKS